MLGLRWSGAAKKDLARLLNYISDDSPAAALLLREQIDRLIATAREYPLGFRPGRLANTRELVAHPNYIVVYRVFDDRIDIIAVLHARQEYP